MLGLRCLWVVIASVIILSTSAFADYHKVEELAPDITLEVSIKKKTYKRFDGERETVMTRESNLWIKSSSSDEQTPMLMKLNCIHDPDGNSFLIEYSFDIRVKNMENGKPIYFDITRPAKYSYRFNDQPFSEELWNHLGYFYLSEKDPRYVVQAIPADYLSDYETMPDANDKKLVSFIEEMRHAKTLQIKFTLENGWTKENLFDLSSFDKSFERLNTACTWVAKQEQ